MLENYIKLSLNYLQTIAFIPVLLMAFMTEKMK